MVCKTSNGDGPDDAAGHPHVFLVSFPGQGHVNPLLRLGKLLASNGLLVTLSAPESWGDKIRKSNNNISNRPVPVGDGIVRFEFFDDEREKITEDELYAAHLEQIGKKKLPEMIKKHEEEGHPVFFLIYNSFIPWVSEVAETIHIPCAALWVQSCACFSAYYHFYHSLVPFPTESQPEIDVQLPRIPLLKFDEVPSFLHPSTPYPSLRNAILGQFRNLSRNSCILMDTFQELESDVIQYMSRLCPLKPIGPLFKYPDQNPSTVNVSTLDMLKADDYADWLDSKPPSSVVYISFGTVVNLKQEQVTEIAHGLLNSGVLFLWVMRPLQTELPDGFLEKAGDNGKVVQWSQQQLVLAHPSIACFMTHCGWNSTMEALACGVPVLAFPHWGDQVTDAKYLVDEFKVGMRLCRGETENKIILRGEVEKCLHEAITGPKAAELKVNALKWKKKADEAVAEGGSSHLNLQTFLNELTIRRNSGSV